jgi:hypothetical protein
MFDRETAFLECQEGIEKALLTTNSTTLSPSIEDNTVGVGS